jgi:hypothetical protein
MTKQVKQEEDVKRAGGNASAPTDAKAEVAPLAEAVWSSNVLFFPPSNKYWRIGNQWYDLNNFNHPGGKQILELSRDRFEDATFVFESHHHDYKRARKVLNKYLVPDHVLEEKKKDPSNIIKSRPSRPEGDAANKLNVNGNGDPKHIHHDVYLDSNKHPKLMADDAFYSVLRQRVADYLRDIGNRSGGPTWECVILFWVVFFSWAATLYWTWYSGSVAFAFASGILGSFLGAFGHNWVHQPKYKDWGWAILSLDTVGFSSECWYRDHVLQHHM